MFMLCWIAFVCIIIIIIIIIILFDIISSAKIVQ